MVLNFIYPFFKVMLLHNTRVVELLDITWLLVSYCTLALIKGHPSYVNFVYTIIGKSMISMCTSRRGSTPFELLWNFISIVPLPNLLI